MKEEDYKGLRVPKLSSERIEELRAAITKSDFDYDDDACFSIKIEGSKAKVMGCEGISCTESCLLDYRNHDTFKKYLDQLSCTVTTEFKTKIEGEWKMNQNIVEVFEKTADAVVVERYLTPEIKDRILLEVHKKAILAACTEAKDAAEKANK